MVSYKYISYYCGLVYCINIIFRTIQGDCFFIVLHLVKRFVWYRSVFTKFSYYRDFFCLEPASCLHDHHCHGWMCYIDTTKITALMFVWYCLVFIQYIYYSDFFCLGPALCIPIFYCYVWVHYVDAAKTVVACMSLLLLSIDIRRFCYFIMFHFKLTNGAMMKW